MLVIMISNRIFIHGCIITGVNKKIVIIRTALSLKHDIDVVDTSDDDPWMKSMLLMLIMSMKIIMIVMIILMMTMIIRLISMVMSVDDLSMMY